MKADKNIKFNKMLFKENQKIIIFSLVVITIITLIGTAALQFLKSFDEYFNESKDTELDKRTLRVTKLNEGYAETINNLNDLKITHVIDAQYDKNELNTNIKIKNYTEKLTESEGIIKGIRTNKIYELVQGNNLNFENKNEAICPEHYLPINSINYSNYSTKDYINGKELLNKTLETEYGNFKIVGLYKDNLFFDKNICLVNYDSISNYLEESNIDLSTALVIVDKSKNISTVRNNFEKMGYKVDSIVMYDEEYLYKIHTIPIYIILIVIAILLISISIIIKKIINHNTEQIKLFKVMGYQNLVIENGYNYIINSIVITSFIITIIIYILIIFILHYFIIGNDIVLSHLKINMDLLVIIFIILLNLILPKLIFNRKLKKMLNAKTIVINGE